MFSPEFRLLLLSCRPDDAGEGVAEARKIIEENQIDWDRLFLRADIHSVRPQLSQLINKSGMGLVPEGFRERLSNAYQDNLCYQISYAVLNLS